MTDVFTETRRLVTTRDVAELNDLHPNPGGFICCPFHDEQTPSLKLYRDGGWKCFGCGKGGSSIDFVMELFDLSPLQAVQKMNTDFMLGLELDKPPDAETMRAAQRRRKLTDTYQRFEQWRTATIRTLNACFRLAHEAIRDLEAPEDLDKLTDGQALAIREQPRLEWLADTLTDGTMAEMMDIFRERGRIGQLCEKILNSTKPKSAVA